MNREAHKQLYDVFELKYLVKYKFRQFQAHKSRQITMNLIFNFEHLIMSVVMLFILPSHSQSPEVFNKKKKSQREPTKHR